MMQLTRIFPIPHHIKPLMTRSARLIPRHLRCNNVLPLQLLARGTRLGFVPVLEIYNLVHPCHEQALRGGGCACGRAFTHEYQNGFEG